MVRRYVRQAAPLSASPPAVSGRPTPDRASRPAGTRFTRVLERLLTDSGPARWP